MKLKSWLSTCSSSTSTAASAPSPHSPPPHSLTSDASSSLFSPDSQTNSSSSSSTSSIQSNLSLLTLPSVPSLQKLTLSPLNDAVLPPTTTAALLASLTPTRRAHVNSLAVHGGLLYAAASDSINVYNIKSFILIDAFDAGGNCSVKSIAFRDGKIFTAHQDCKIRVWRLNNKNEHKLISTLPTLEDRLRRFIFPQNYVNIRRHKKKLWIQHYDVVAGLATTCLDNDVKTVFSVSWDRSIKIWHAKKLTCLDSINKAHDDAINAVVISKDGSIIYTGSADKRIKAWKKEGKKYGLIATLEKHKSAVNALALSQDGSVLFSGSCDRSILVWEREDSANHMAVTGALRGHAKAVLCMINVRDLLVSGSGDRTVRIWRRGFDGMYCCLAVLKRHRAPVRSLAAEVEDGGGVKVFSGSFDGEIKVWQIEVAKGLS